MKCPICGAPLENYDFGDVLECSECGKLVCIDITADGLASGNEFEV